MAAFVPASVCYFAATNSSCLNFTFWPTALVQGTWSSAVTSKLLLEAGGSAMLSYYSTPPQPEVRPNDISILELSTGFLYNAGRTFAPNTVSHRLAQRFGVTYVTGSHAFKVGVQLEEGVQDGGDQQVNGDVNYQFLNGAPVSLTQYAQPFRAKEILKADLGIFIQDQWTIKRLTLNMGLRFDYFNSYVPEQHVPAGPWVPARDFEPVRGVPLWKDVNPRMGASYDLFGNGRTVADNCFVIDSPQQLLNCRVVAPWSANLQLKLFGSYPSGARKSTFD